MKSVVLELPFLIVFSRYLRDEHLEARQVSFFALLCLLLPVDCYSCSMCKLEGLYMYIRANFVSFVQRGFIKYTALSAVLSHYAAASVTNLLRL